MYISFELGAESHERLLNLARMLCDVVGTHQVLPATDTPRVIINQTFGPGTDRKTAAQVAAASPLAAEIGEAFKKSLEDVTISPMDPRFTLTLDKNGVMVDGNGNPVVITGNPAPITETLPRAMVAAAAGAISEHLAAQVQTVIAPADNPETGAPVPQPPAPPAPVSEAAAAFGAVPLPPPAPPAAASAPASSATPVSGPSATGSPALDADGLPWDARIHAGGQAKNADGRWRARRGVNDAALVARVTAELRAAMGAPAAPPPPVPPAPPVPGAPPVPPAALAPWPELCLFTARGKTEGWLTDDHIAGALQAVGLPGLPMLTTRPDLIPTVRATLEAYRPAGAV